jgi:hypothetical protein
MAAPLAWGLRIAKPVRFARRNWLVRTLSIPLFFPSLVGKYVAAMLHELHPIAYPAPETRIQARFIPQGVEYRVENSRDLARPRAAPPLRADGLWEHGCFELFVRPDGGKRYFEFNFALDGRWAAYAFDDYRAGRRDLPLAKSPEILWNGKRCIAKLDLSELPPRPWHVNLAAVVEERDGRKSYWAVHPTRGREPDFHDPACFSIAVA